MAAHVQSQVKLLGQRIEHTEKTYASLMQIAEDTRVQAVAAEQKITSIMKQSPRESHSMAATDYSQEDGTDHEPSETHIEGNA